MNAIFAQTGTQGTGKSDAASDEYKRLKRKYGTGVAFLADIEAECKYAINQKTTEESQEWMFGYRIYRELDALYHFDLVATDRTLMDIIAYTHVAGFHDLAQDMLTYAASHMRHYKKIYFRHAKTNDYCVDDGIRDTDPCFRAAVEDALFFYYETLLLTGSWDGELIHV